MLDKSGSRINLAVDYFLRGLLVEIGNKARLVKPNTLEFAIEKAEITEKTFKINSHEITKSLNVMEISDKTESKSILEPYKNDLNTRLNQFKEVLNEIENFFSLKL